VIQTALLHGIDAVLVSVETDISNGMPSFDMVGYLSSEVRESRERVRSALKNCGYQLPVKRITVNLSPASLRKSGSGFDLPVALSILSCDGVLSPEAVEDVFVVGELGLDGSIKPCLGILPMMFLAREKQVRVCLVPKENLTEARLVEGVPVVGVSHIREAISFLKDGEMPVEYTGEINGGKTGGNSSETGNGLSGGKDDFQNIHGQKLLKRACEVAVSGMHNLLMIGPPGAGKTMIARAIPSILPSMTQEEQLVLSKIYSVSGLFGERVSLLTKRPFRSPHHTVTSVGLTGGGTVVRPGEISLAHGGVLFLDELPEFSKQTLEILRQPMEEKVVHITRAGGQFVFPADFMLVAAMNPCRCGYFPDMNRCRCSRRDITSYLSRISQPLIDRIDITVEAAAIGFSELKKESVEESSAEIRDRVVRVHEIQKQRFINESYHFNSQIPAEDLEKYCPLGEKEERYMEQMFYRMNLTARTYHKMLRVARTLADMEGAENIGLTHLNEAVCYRSADKKYWEDNS